jgi:hypothetical protein
MEEVHTSSLEVSEPTYFSSPLPEAGRTKVNVDVPSVGGEPLIRHVRKKINTEKSFTRARRFAPTTRST